VFSLIAQLIHILELDSVADWLIGDEVTGIPRGERKRFTIGVELVTNPSVLVSVLSYIALRQSR
jgi:ABC-type multidrug transport system ATPase subunit